MSGLTAEQTRPPGISPTDWHDPPSPAEQHAEHAAKLGDETLLIYRAELVHRDLLEIDLADVAPARLAAALLATPAGRSAIAAHMVSRRHSNGHEKPEEMVEAIRADVAGGLTIYATSKKHGVAFNTVKRYVAEGKKLAEAARDMRADMYGGNGNG